MHPLPSSSGNPLLSVIIPVYNTAPYLQRCLDSMYNQTYKNLEIICVDDGSTDGSVEILKAQAEKDKRIILLLHEHNKGNGAARNWALDVASGIYVTDVDSDDFVSPEAYEEAIQLMTDGVDVVHYGIKVEAPPSPWAEQMQKYYNFSESGIYKLTDDLIYKLQDSLCCKIMRRSIIEKYHLRFPEGIWYEDYCFKYEYLSVCSTVYIYQKQFYHRTLRNSSIMGQSRQGNPKSLDRFAAYDIVCSFLKDNGLWETRKKLVQLIYETSKRQVRTYSSELQERAKQLQREFAAKYGLDQLFASPAGRNKKQSDKPKVVSEIRCYGFCRWLPVLTIRTSQDKRTGGVRIRAKLFGLFPLISGRGYANRMHWKLFNFIPFWRSEKRGE